MNLQRDVQKRAPRCGQGTGTPIAADLGGRWVDAARLTIALLCAGAWAAANAAPPQTVYRCGPEGRVYSQTPCTDGRLVTLDDSRSASQQKAAKDVAARDAQQAQQLADERRQREAQTKNQAAAGIKPAPGVEPASAPVRKTKAKAPVPDPTMSPSMRMPVQAAGSK